MMWHIISWVGATGFAVCGIPQVISTIRAGHSDGLSWGFLLLWLLGEVCTFAFILHTFPSPPLVVNYTLNGICLTILIWYKCRPRKVVKKREKVITYKELHDHYFPKERKPRKERKESN